MLAAKINPFNINIQCYCSIVLESLGRLSEALDVLSIYEQNSNAIIYYRKAKLLENLNSLSVKFM